MINELYEATPIVEVDDFHVAQAIVNDVLNMHPVMQMSRIALWAARLREHYVAIGRDLDNDELREA